MTVISLVTIVGCGAEVCDDSLDAGITGYHRE